MSEIGSERAIAESRRQALEKGADFLHALGCEDCGLEEEALFTLSLLGWSKPAYIRDLFDHLLREVPGD